MFLIFLSPYFSFFGMFQVIVVIFVPRPYRHKQQQPQKKNYRHAALFFHIYHHHNYDQLKQILRVQLITPTTKSSFGAHGNDYSRYYKIRTGAMILSDANEKNTSDDSGSSRSNVVDVVTTTTTTKPIDHQKHHNPWHAGTIVFGMLLGLILKIAPAPATQQLKLALHPRKC